MGYPHQIDCAWLASDATGQLAAMITAGSGPMPALVANGPVEVVDIEDMLLTLPVICDGRVVYGDGDSSSFLRLSSRGLFVYDWSDVHRVSGPKDAYELMVVPTIPLTLSNAPHEIRNLAFNLETTFGLLFVHIHGPQEHA